MGRKKLFLITIACVLAWAMSQTACSFLEFRQSDEQLTTYFFQKKISTRIVRYPMPEGRTIRYIEAGASDSMPTVVIIHGAPSSLSVANGVLSDTNLLRVAKTVGVDRPGYGYSDYGWAETSISRQAELLAPMLENLKAKSQRRPTVLMGVSFGGPIAAYLAAERPDLVDGLILAAPAIEPGAETVYDISYPMRWRLTSWLFPASLVVATDEKFVHKAELTAMLPLWERIKIPVAYIQGEDDEVVNPSSAKFARRMLVNAPSLEITMIPNQKHFLSIPQRKLLVNTAIQMVEKVSLKKK